MGWISTPELGQKNIEGMLHRETYSVFVFYHTIQELGFENVVELWVRMLFEEPVQYLTTSFGLTSVHLHHPFN